MRKQCLRILIALIAFASLGTAAKGRAIDQIKVDIPYDFVVAGKTLPPGTYKVNRVTVSHQKGLVISSLDNRVSAIVLPIEVEDSDVDKAQVSFEQVAGEHFLSKVETANHSFTIPIPRSATLAAGRSLSGTSASRGSEATN
jgi:hypothetical protein